MARFFAPEKGIWPFFGRLADVLMLSLLWTVCSAPLLTLGAASAALYDAAVACFRGREQDCLGRFFRTLRREFRASLLPTLLWAAILGLLLRGAVFVTHALEGRAALIFTSALLVLLLIPLGAACWVFPLLSRFTLDFKALNLNALRLALGHILATFAVALGCAVSAWLTLRLAFLPLFFLPALLALWFSLFMEPVFRRYEPGGGD